MFRDRFRSGKNLLRASQHSRSRFLRLEQLEQRQLLALTNWYTFNDGTATDLVGGEDLTPVNGVSLVGGQALLSNVGVDSGDSGAVQYLDLPPAALPGSGSATIVTWFTTSNAANWTRVFDIGNQSGSNGDSYLFFSPQTSTGESRLVLSPGGGAGNERIATTATTDDGAQHMLAAVVDTGANTLRLYLDGSEVDTASLEGSSMASINQAVAWFGRSLYNSDDGFTGSFDEIRIYDEALDSATIETAYDDGPVPVPPPDPSNLPARQVEALDRGVVAVRTSGSQVYVGWRMLATDPTDVAFNLYRSTNGARAVKLNANPLTQTTDWVDTTATLSQSNEYFVRPIMSGVVLGASGSYTLPANSSIQQYLGIPLQIPAPGVTPSGENYTYNANDASVGDLDGDGEYEVILKWDPSNSKDNSQSGYTGNTYVDAYELDGTMLWRIDLGRNVRSGAHYLPFTVYDLDGDGKAELVMRTSDATVDGQGNVIGNPAADYRNGSGYVLSGPEYLTVFNGETGAVIDSADYLPARESVASWGDTYGNRVNRFQMSVAYLDGATPSIVIARGYAGPQSGLSARNEVAAFDYANGEVSPRWLFEAATNGLNPGYVGQTAHSITVGDVDFDGKDEVITGAAAIDDDGSLLHNTGWGHGDALHMSDMIPSRPGLEVFMPHEYASSNGNIGATVRDAATGELIFSIYGDGDIGRGVAADIDPNSPGYEYWATTSEPGENRKVWSSAGEPLYDIPGNMHYNFAIWWDADLTRETLDGTIISEWNNPGRSNQLEAWREGATANNGSKNTPALQADILGDWREEVIWRRNDNSELMIFTTTIAANNRLPTLMHDTQYRAAIAFQNSGYNQPPHPSFFLGAGMSDPPVPNIYTVSANPKSDADFERDGDVDADDLSVWQQTYGTSQSQGTLPGDATSDGTVSGIDFLIWQREKEPTPSFLVAAEPTVVVEDLSAQDDALAALMGIEVDSSQESRESWVPTARTSFEQASVAVKVHSLDVLEDVGQELEQRDSSETDVATSSNLVTDLVFAWDEL